MYFPDPHLPPIIIVDDSADDAFLMRYRLRAGDVANPLQFFADAGAALAQLRTLQVLGGSPHLLFTEIRMPGGFELIGSVRDDPVFDDLKVVVSTYSNDPGDLKRALDLRVDGYMLKFPDPETLGEYVRHGPWFELSRRLRPAEQILCA